METLPPETELTVSAGGIKIVTTVGKFLKSYDDAFDEGYKAGIAEEQPKREVAEEKLSDLLPKYESVRTGRNLALIGDVVLPVLAYLLGRACVQR